MEIKELLSKLDACSQVHRADEKREKILKDVVLSILKGEETELSLEALFNSTRPSAEIRSVNLNNAIDELMSEDELSFEQREIVWSFLESCPRKKEELALVYDLQYKEFSTSIKNDQERERAHQIVLSIKKDSLKNVGKEDQVWKWHYFMEHIVKCCASLDERTFEVGNEMLHWFLVENKEHTEFYKIEWSPLIRSCHYVYKRVQPAMITLENLSHKVYFARIITILGVMESIKDHDYHNVHQNIIVSEMCEPFINNIKMRYQS